MPAGSTGDRSTCTTPPSSYGFPRVALWSKTAGPSLTPTARRAAWPWRARWAAAGWGAGGCSATRIADASEAVASPQLLSQDPVVAHRLLALVDSLPSPVWGRDELGTGEMWNSNSVIAWLLAQSGLPTDAIRPPAGGRTPGWQAGLVTARRQPPTAGPDGHRSSAGPRSVATTA
jgi:hypothetical protein